MVLVLFIRTTAEPTQLACHGLCSELNSGYYSVSRWLPWKIRNACIHSVQCGICCIRPTDNWKCNKYYNRQILLDKDTRNTRWDNSQIKYAAEDQKYAPQNIYRTKIMKITTVQLLKCKIVRTKKDDRTGKSVQKVFFEDENHLSGIRGRFHQGQLMLIGDFST